MLVKTLKSLQNDYLFTINRALERLWFLGEACDASEA